MLLIMRQSDNNLSNTLLKLYCFCFQQNKHGYMSLKFICINYQLLHVSVFFEEFNGVSESFYLCWSTRNGIFNSLTAFSKYSNTSLCLLSTLLETVDPL